jgi:hypothetical protein
VRANECTSQVFCTYEFSHLFRKILIKHNAILKVELVIVMSAESLPFCFEPLTYVIRSSRQRLSSRQLRLDRRYVSDYMDIDYPADRLGGAYFFQKAVAENREEFETIDVQKELMILLSKGTKSILKRLREKLGSVLLSTEAIDTVLPQDFPEHLYLSRITRELPSRVYFHKTCPVAIFPVSSVSMFVLGNNKDDVKKAIKDIKSKCEELSEVTVDFGMELVKFLTSRDYQRSLLENLENIQKTEYGKPKNDFEKEVVQACEKITTSFLPNLTIIFDKPRESFEYDLFFGFGEESRVIVEPTDYESLKSELINGKVGKDTLKSRIILGTLDKARRLRAESVVVVKGFPERTFMDLKSLADSRGVRLMSNENYEKILPSIFLNNISKTFRPAR